jgi:hypothetical protein
MADPEQTVTEGEARPGPVGGHERYGVRDGCTVRLERDREGHERADVLATFSARIEEEVTIDDGIETRRLFRISCRLKDGTRLKDALVPAAEFEGLSWVLKHWGHRALIFSGGGRRDHLRTAIQLASQAARARTVYTHTGWRREGDRWIYLYQGGAVGSDDVEVRLDPPFERFVLPAAAEDVGAAIRASLSLLECGPLEVTAPLLGAVYAAPLSFVLNPDFAVWVVGLTGSLKSELASLAQRHFGPFTRKTLPGSWSSTGNSLEALLAVTKDMLAVIDDFAPQADAQAQREQTKRAEVLLRNVGNHTGRGRLRPDLSQRPVRPPRCLVLCTGEDHPPTPSIVARLVLVEVDRSRLNLAAVTRLQSQGELLPHAMRAYIEWLQPRMDELRVSLPAELVELMRGEFSAVSLASHLRAPGGLATLHLGAKLFFRFAEAYGATTTDEANGTLARVKEALTAIGRRQAKTLSAHRPTIADEFVAALRALLTEKKVWLRTRGDGASSDAEVRGPSTEFVGWREGEHVYVLPEPAVRAVATYRKVAGLPAPTSTGRLLDALAKSRLVIAASGGKATQQLRFGNARHRVLVFAARTVLEPESGGRT